MMKIKPISTLCLTLLLSASGAALSPALAQNYNLPSLGSAGAGGLSVSEERRLGEELMVEVRNDRDYLSDPETVEYLNRLGYKLVAATSGPGYDFFFFPIRDASINAFALPGGFIAVHSGLLTAASSESELASVLAHEVSHVQQRHIARMLESRKGDWAVTLGSILVAILAARAGSGDAAAASVMGAQAALASNSLAFSRDAEREADRVGFNALARAGFDPKGMQNFFERLDFNNRAYEGERAAPAYLRTHPLTLDRMSEAQVRSRTAPRISHTDSLDFYLIRARMRVLQATGFDGFKRACEYFKTELKTAKGPAAAAAYYGLAVAEQKMNLNTQALSDAETAVKLAGKNNAILTKLYSNLVFDSSPSMRSKGLALAREGFEKSPLSSMMVLNYAEMLIRDRKFDQAISLMRKQHALSKTSISYQSVLARIYEAQGKKSLSHLAIGEMYALQGLKTAAIEQFALAQRANDGDFYTMSEIDARLRAMRKEVDFDQKHQ